MKQLVYVSSNKAKSEEAEQILGQAIESVSLEIPEIQSFDLEKIIRAKALSAYEQLGRPLLVDQAGFYIDAWNGFPGPFIKFIFERGGQELFLKMLEHEINRVASNTCAIGYHDGKKVHVFFGENKGTITTEIRGTTNPIGYNPVFVPEGSDKTFAEMTVKEKNQFSHRGKALRALKEFLNENKR